MTMTLKSRIAKCKEVDITMFTAKAQFLQMYFPANYYDFQQRFFDNAAKYLYLPSGEGLDRKYDGDFWDFATVETDRGELIPLIFMDKHGLVKLVKDDKELVMDSLEAGIALTALTCFEMIMEEYDKERGATAEQMNRYYAVLLSLAKGHFPFAGLFLL